MLLKQILAWSILCASIFGGMLTWAYCYDWAAGVLGAIAFLTSMWIAPLYDDEKES